MKLRTILIFVVLTLWFATALRVWDLGDTSLWLDETFTYERASAESFIDVLNITANYATQAPLYYLVLQFFPSEPEFGLRLSSVLVGILGVGLLIGVVRKLYQNDRLALMVGVLLACNPYHVWLSRNARAYSLLFIFILMASFFFLRLLQNRRSMFNWVAFIGTSACAYITHYFGLALPLVQGIYLGFLLLKDWKHYWTTARAWGIAQFIAGLPLLVWVLKAAPRNSSVAEGTSWIPDAKLTDIVLTLTNLTTGYDGSFAWYFVPGLIAVALGLGMSLYFYMSPKQTPNFYWWVAALAPLLAIFIVSLKRPLYVDRYFVVIVPALVILMLQGWNQIKNPVLLNVLVGAVLFSSLSTIIVTISDGNHEREDWRDALAYIQDERQTNDRILVGWSILTEPPFRFYFEASDPMRHKQTILFDELDREDRLNGRVWVVFRNPRENLHGQGVMPEYDPLNEDNDLSRWLNHWQDQIIQRNDFQGITVFLLDFDVSITRK